MFVFPAFDSNYNTRKRSFKCCQHCRRKRVKCEITSTNFESVGCLNCRKHGLSCDLIKYNVVSEEIRNSNDGSEFGSIKESNLGINTVPGGATKIIVPDQTRRITPQYLKERFNFNISEQDLRYSYQYLFHGHPKAIISNQVEDNSLWHESGVYVDDRSKEGDFCVGFNKKEKGRDRGSGYYIRNNKTYDFLLSIEAFTLSTTEYPFEYADVKELVYLYFYKINCLFPIVDEIRFWNDFRENKTQNIVIYAMVLVILRDKLAEPILKRVFERNKLRLDPYSEELYSDYLISFIFDLESKIRQINLILPQLGDIDKLCKLVVLLLMSLHFNFDKLGNEQSSHDVTDSINLAVSLGIHMKRQDKNTSSEGMAYSTNLWWCCYVFDTFNGLTNSRCIFIKERDFNVDLPYNNINLLRIVQLSRTLNNMLISVFQPFDNNDMEFSMQTRNKLFNADEFKKMEFEFCRRERQNGNNLYDSSGIIESNGLIKTENSSATYSSIIMHFLSRIINNTIILLSQKAQYDDNKISNYIPESVAIEASLNILRYVLKIKEELIIHIPLIPWSLTIAMAVALKRKAKYMLKNGNQNDSKYEYDNDENDSMYDLQDYIDQLDKFSSKWWVVDEICKLSKEFTEKLSTTSTLKKKGKPKENQNKRQKTKQPTKGDEFKSINKTNDVYNSMDIKYKYQALLPSLNTPKSIPSILSMLKDNSKESLSNESNPSEADSKETLGSQITTSPVYSRTASNSPFSSQYHDFLESMHLDLFDNEFLKDFPNIVNQLMDKE